MLSNTLSPCLSSFFLDQLHSRGHSEWTDKDGGKKNTRPIRVLITERFRMSCMDTKLGIEIREMVRTGSLERIMVIVSRKIKERAKPEV